METGRKSQVVRLHRVVCVLVALLLVAGSACQTGTEVAEVQNPAEVKRELAEVWAGAGDADPLPKLTDGNWHDLPAGGLVTTDDDGEAWVDIDNCELIYVFKKSGLKKADCSKATYSAGNVVCAVEGTSAYNNSCASEVIIQTASADLTLQGTWVAVTYLPDQQLTLVQVFDGRVTVTPILDVSTRDPDSKVDVEKGQFLFTAPGEKPTDIAGLAARKPLPMSDLPTLVGELATIDSDLEPWMQRVWERVEMDGIQLPEPFMFQDTTLFLRGGGGVLGEARVQEALLNAMDKEALAENNLPNRDVKIVSKLPGWELEDAREVGYDLEYARMLLEEAGIDKFAVLFLYPPDDEPLRWMVEQMTEGFKEIGVEAELVAMPTDDAAVEMEKRLEADEPVLWLSRR